MAVKVLIPTPLQKLTDGKDVVEAPAGKIIDIINALDKKYPGLAERLCQDGKIRRFINVYLNEEDIRFLQGEETLVKDGDEVSIVPAIAGGNF
ncbi:MAG: MoaD/ThiS family protein [Thermodesulfovibrio sp.]|jgi:molybdopterin synthase sulfur carrier subunit|uniref:MoaD/ThiS family protein n=1 Tax=unclassified Thermodesulfovibrio TaxID=2645936 RepID=UPI00083ABF8C|nr:MULTISPECIES: MoaD/ThiS family protein [unclassified Thermodesulfovibrio]MDI1471863.1 MoaD/ThiS family protein [Thermodesulfovibrio sp. 1176]MDI6714934.1 MoaD/ThiS family protein [Thermodesulfovibrio sp.]ODA44811.1 MoaD and/or ThiS family protein [Thermodesulfovibrio sp. N1]